MQNTGKKQNSNKNFSLKPWQHEAVDRTIKNKRFAIFDSVGLGKTIEALYSVRLLSSVKQQRVLIILESSVENQWKEEVEKILNIYAYSSNNKNKINRRKSYKEFYESSNNIKVIIISYALLRVDFDLVNSLDINFVIADEAGILSNENQTSKYFKWLVYKVERVLLLTATPVQRDIVQFYHIFDVMGVSLMGKHEFINKFAITSILNLKRRQIVRVVGSKNQQVLAKTYSKYFIRRNKKHVSKYLKEVQKSYMYKTFPMSEVQLSLYKKAKQDSLNILNQTLAPPLNLCLTLYNNLLKILDHPFLYDSSLKEETSPKIEGLINVLKSFKNESVFIYTKFIKFGNLVEDCLNASFGEGSAYFINGEIDKMIVNSIIDGFKKNKFRFLIGSDIAKRGLNLQISSNIVFMDFPALPADVAQLIGRLDRVGQESKLINVIFLLMEDTIENNRYLTLKRRQKEFDELFSENNSESVFSKEEFINTV